MSFSLAQDFLDVLSTYASAIIIVLLVFVLLGAARGWVSGIGSAWGIVGVAAMLVIFGIYAAWAGLTVVGVILVLLGVGILVLDAMSERRNTRAVRRAARRD